MNDTAIALWTCPTCGKTEELHYRASSPRGWPEQEAYWIKMAAELHSERICLYTKALRA